MAWRDEKPRSFNTYAASPYLYAIRDSNPGTTDLALFIFVLSLLITPGVEAALHLGSR